MRAAGLQCTWIAPYIGVGTAGWAPAMVGIGQGPGEGFFPGASYHKWWGRRGAALGRPRPGGPGHARTIGGSVGCAEEATTSVVRSSHNGGYPRLE